jgi:hypothetical protein
MRAARAAEAARPEIPVALPLLEQVADAILPLAGEGLPLAVSALASMSPVGLEFWVLRQLAYELALQRLWSDGWDQVISSGRPMSLNGATQALPCLAHPGGSSFARGAWNCNAVTHLIQSTWAVVGPGDAFTVGDWFPDIGVWADGGFTAFVGGPVYYASATPPTAAVPSIGEVLPHPDIGQLGRTWPIGDQFEFPEILRPMVDPLARPGEVPWLVPNLPYRFLPERVPNPWRAPEEQPRRGNYPPFPEWQPGGLPGAPVVAPVEWPIRSPETSPVTQPARNPESDPRPDQDPDGAPNPVPVPVPDTRPRPEPGRQLEPIRDVFPAGAIGPSIVVGPGAMPDVYTPSKPPKGTKERKRKFTIQGSALVRHGQNPITEALEVVDCAFKSLPKGTRWSAQKQSWQDQKDALRKKGVPWVKSTKPNIQGSKGIDIFGDGKHSIGLPGGVPRWVKPPFDGQNRLWSMSPQEKMAAVYNHFLDGDFDLGGMVECIATNEVEDRLYGAAGQGLAKGSRRTGMSHGIGLGPAF